MMRATHERRALAATLTMVLAAAAACGANADASVAGAATAAVPVRAETVASRAIAPGITATGVLAGKEEITLSFKIGGVVARVAVDEGATVREGQLLAELTQTEIGSEVEKAAQAQMKALRDFERTQRLYRDSVVTLEQLQDASTASEVAESNLRIAQFNRDWSVIRAPAAGVILRKSVEGSQLVAAGAPVLVMRTTRRGLVLRVGLSDRDAMRLRLGDPTTVRFDAVPEETFRGSVAQIASAADAMTGTYEVEVAVEPRGTALASGLVGTIDITPRRTVNLPLVPIEALVEGDGDSATVYVLSGDSQQALRRRVRVAFISGDAAAIASGISAGERVITSGAGFVRDSSVVRLGAAAGAKEERR